MRLPLALCIFLSVLPGTGRAQTFADFLARVSGAPPSEKPALVDSFLAAVPRFPLVEQDSLAHFLYRGAASSASAPGDVNGWQPAAAPMTLIDGTDLWYRTLVLPPDARLDYKFVLNGSSWILDPRNPLTVSGGFGPNSELRMSAYVPAPEIAYNPAIPHGTLRDTTFFSSALGNSRTVRVYLPPSYSASQDSFGVLLVHDGLEYVTLAQTNNVLDFLIHEGSIRPLIAVFVPPVNRTAEYAGTQMSQFSSFIVGELMPYIEQRYRTRRDPAERAVLGASNGGNIALWLALTYPAVFGNVAAQSSNVISSISAGFQNGPTLPLRVYLDIGRYDIAVLIPLVRSLRQVLTDKQYDLFYREYNEGHSWGNWRAHVDDALKFFFPATPTSVAAPPDGLPPAIALEPYPNPSNSSVRIHYSIPGEAFVTLELLDTAGRRVAMLQEGSMTAGSYTVAFESARLASGMYFCRLKASTGPGRPGVVTRKLLLLK